MSRWMKMLSGILGVVLFVVPAGAGAVSVEHGGGGVFLLAASTEGGTPTVTETGSTQSKVNLNTADEKALAQVNGIGTALAREIIKYRVANGRFKSIDDLKHVKGVGQTQLDAIQAVFYAQ